MDKNKLANDVASILEQTLARHGVNIAVLEGTLDDAETIINTVLAARDDRGLALSLIPGWATKPNDAKIPEGYHEIETQQGRRLSHMSQLEYDGWVNGNRISYADYSIIPKRDFGQHGFYDAKSRTNIREGWVITQKGANAMPGATWAHTQEDALMMIDCLLAVEGDGKRFWHMLRAIQRASGKLA